jgi:hypothetical protein
VVLPAGEEQYLIVGISYDAFGPRSA